MAIRGPGNIRGTPESGPTIAADTRRQRSIGMRVSTDVSAGRRRQADPMTVVIQIALEELDPPVGEVLYGDDAVSFAGWLDLFHLLGRLVESPRSSPDG